MDMDLRKDFGLRLRKLRKSKHWAQKELAAQVGVQTSQLNKYECGVNMPPAENLLLFAEIFDVSLDFLLTGKNPAEIPLNSSRLMERMKDLEDLEAEDQEAILRLVDAMIVKHRVEGALKRRKKVG